MSFIKNYLIIEPISFMHIDPSKVVVGVDRHMNAPSMHIQKALLGKNCLSSYSCHFVKNYFF